MNPAEQMCGPASAAAVHDVRITLPEQWWLVPLRDPGARSRAISRLVERQFAGIENQPHLRAQTRDLLEGQAVAAAELGARLMALSVADYAGVPVPASLLVHWIDIPPLYGRGALLMDLRDSLVPVDGTLPPGQSLDLARIGPGPVLRHVHSSTAALEPGEEPLPSLGADYWLERPDGAGLVQFVFATPVLEVREAMPGLFDAIVSAVRWVPDAG